MGSKWLTWMRQINLLVLALALSIPAHAVAPALIIFYGELLEKPVRLAGAANMFGFWRLIQEEALEAKEDSLLGRAFIDVAVFWGPDLSADEWKQLPFLKLQPERASQHGRFYPAASDADPVLVLEPATLRNPHDGTAHVTKHPMVIGGPRRKIDRNGLRILTTHGIPVEKR